MSLSNEQIKELVQPVDPARVKRNEKGYSHLAIQDVRARLNQIFGFGNWSQEILDMQLVSENETTTKAGKDAWYVVYRALSKITIHATGAVYSEWASGDSTHPTRGEAHDLAIKTAESQATKRACVNLGDQFGLSLYEDGSVEPLVRETVGQEFADSNNVPIWISAFESATNFNELSETAKRIRGADISTADRNTLLAAYKTASERIDPS